MLFNSDAAANLVAQAGSKNQTVASLGNGVFVTTFTDATGAKSGPLKISESGIDLFVDNASTISVSGNNLFIEGPENAPDYVYQIGSRTPFFTVNPDNSAVVRSVADPSLNRTITGVKFQGWTENPDGSITIDQKGVKPYTINGNELKKFYQGLKAADGSDFTPLDSVAAAQQAADLLAPILLASNDYPAGLFDSNDAAKRTFLDAVAGQGDGLVGMHLQNGILQIEGTSGAIYQLDQMGHWQRIQVDSPDSAHIVKSDGSSIDLSGPGMGTLAGAGNIPVSMSTGEISAVPDSASIHIVRPGPFGSTFEETFVNGIDQKINYDADGLLQSASLTANGVTTVSTYTGGVLTSTAVIQKDGNGTTVSQNNGAPIRLSDGQTVSVDSDGNVLISQTVASGNSITTRIDPAGNSTATVTDIDGTILSTTTTEPNTTVQNLNSALPSVVDALNLLKAIQTGQPLPIVASGLTLANAIEKGSLPDLAGASSAANGVLSILSLENALKNGNAAAAIAAGAQTLGYAASAYSDFVGSSTDIGQFLNGTGEQTVDSAGQLIGALPRSAAVYKPCFRYHPRQCQGCGN
jgi:hypothetical protein